MGEPEKEEKLQSRNLKKINCLIFRLRNLPCIRFSRDLEGQGLGTKPRASYESRTFYGKTEEEYKDHECAYRIIHEINFEISTNPCNTGNLNQKTPGCFVYVNMHYR